MSDNISEKRGIRIPETPMDRALIFLREEEAMYNRALVNIKTLAPHQPEEEKNREIEYVTNILKDLDLVREIVASGRNTYLIECFSQREEVYRQNQVKEKVRK